MLVYLLHMTFRSRNDYLNKGKTEKTITKVLLTLIWINFLGFSIFLYQFTLSVFN